MPHLELFQGPDFVWQLFQVVVVQVEDLQDRGHVRQDAAAHHLAQLVVL